MRAITFRQAVIPSALLAVVSLLLIVVSNHYFGLRLLNIPSSVWQSLWHGALFGSFLFVGLFALLKILTPYVLSLQIIAKQLHGLFANFSWPMIIIISLLAGVGEEMLFRALIQNYLIYLTNNVWGITLGALIFGVLHYLNHTYALIASVMGGVFGYIYFVTQDLLLVITLHGVYDFFAFAVIVKYPHFLQSALTKGNK